MLRMMEIVMIDDGDDVDDDDDDRNDADAGAVADDNDDDDDDDDDELFLSPCKGEGHNRFGESVSRLLTQCPATVHVD